MRIQMPCLLSFLVLLSTQTLASDEDPLRRLLATKSLKCEFGQGTSAEWVDGQLKVESAVFSSDPTKAPIHYDTINLKTHSARIIGNSGSTDATVLPSADGISIVEKPLGGGIVVTTVFAHYDRERRFISVLSKHVNVMGPFPQQYYGICKIWDGDR
jgi:hypothetical protein